jgi:hypothetical protein
MTPTGVIVFVDDLRCFADGRAALVARSSADGVALLASLTGSPIAELWLDHDLGGDDTIWPVVEVLERAAFAGAPLDVGAIYVHTANPAGAARIAQVLRRWDYPVHAVPGSPAVAYLG